MKNKNYYKKIVRYFLVLFILCTTTQSGSVFAVDTEFYQSNDILFYNEDDSFATSSCLIKDTNRDYSGAQILNSAQTAQLSSNQIFYKNAVSQSEVAGYNIPWQFLAAIHFKEHKFGRSGPENGFGPFQITKKQDNLMKKGEYTDEEFQSAANEAAIFIKNKIDGDKYASDLSSTDGVKRGFFLYNGAGESYQEQAKSLGYDKKGQEIGEGSPYVMNRADDKRNPTIEPTKSNKTWGQIKRDGGPIEYPANSDVGAFVLYQSISDICSGKLSSGGMDITQAKKFMAEYINGGEQSIKYLGPAKAAQCLPGENALANCVSFSVYFINKYTTLKGFEGSLKAGNGYQVASNVKARNPAVILDNEPGPYAIFSWPKDPEDSESLGHTGVILGVDKEKGTMIIGEAACSQTEQWVIDNINRQVRSPVKIEDWKNRHPGTLYAHIPEEYLNL